MEKSTISDNRFIRYQQEGRKGKLVVLIFLVLFSIGLFVEISLAIIFTARAHFQGKDIQYLFERYFILMPFEEYIDRQDELPVTWKQSYIGSNDPVLNTVLAYLPDPLVDHRLRPDISWTPKKGSTTTTNPQGFATTYKDLRTFEYTPEPDTFRILFLGGSTVEGWGAKNSLYSLPSIFKARVEQQFIPHDSDKARFEVINAGVSDYDSRNEYLYYTNELVHFKPDLVISYNGGNDSMGYPVDSLTHPHWLEPAGYAMNKEILEQSYSVGSLLMRALRITAQETVFFLKRVFVTDVFFKVADWVKYKMQQGSDSSNVDRSAVNDAIVRIYLENMKRLKRELDASNTHFAWFTQPNLILSDYQPKDELTVYLKEHETAQFEGLSDFYVATDKEMKTMVASHDATTTFCAVNVSDVFHHSNTEVYLDVIHVNEEGNRMVAERLLQELEACGLIRKKL